MMTLCRTNSDNIDFQELVSLLNQDLKIRDGDLHDLYNQFNITNSLSEVIVCYLNEQAVGCGALRKKQDQVVEIKRMFVHSSNRKQGIASHVLAELESWARELQFAAVILETGKNQPEAVALYLKQGYIITENFPPYQDAENSVCMKKIL